MRIIFLGTPKFSVPSLEALSKIDFVDIVGVVTHPDKPKGRNLVSAPPPVKIFAEEINLPIFQPEYVSSGNFINKLKDLAPDLIVVVSFGEILSKEVLSIPKLGCINLHTSLLPKYRGAAPISWVILNGERNTGVTIFWLSEKMDAGDIISQKEIEILPSDNKGTLEDKLSIFGAKLLEQTIIKIKEGKAPRNKQDDSKATYAPKIKKQDGLIDWSNSSVSIYNKIRAMNPWPGAYTFFNGTRIEIWEGDVINELAEEKPGTVVLLNKSGIGVAAGNGIVLFKELQAEGKKRIKALDFVHGYRINEGQLFG